MTQSDLRDLKITFIGEVDLTIPQCEIGLVERIVDELTAIMRGDNPDPVYTFIRPLWGPRIVDARKIVSIEVLGGPSIGRWANSGDT